mgnify:CR=1 FL=1
MFLGAKSSATVRPFQERMMNPDGNINYSHQDCDYHSIIVTSPG